MPQVPGSRNTKPLPVRTLSASHDLDTSNNTSNFFVGTTQRSWMNPQFSSSSSNVIPTALLNRNSTSTTAPLQSPVLDVSNTTDCSRPLFSETVNTAIRARSPISPGLVVSKTANGNKQLRVASVNTAVQPQSPISPSLEVSSTANGNKQSRAVSVNVATQAQSIASPIMHQVMPVPSPITTYAPRPTGPTQQAMTTQGATLLSQDSRDSQSNFSLPPPGAKGTTTVPRHIRTSANVPYQTPLGSTNLTEPTAYTPVAATQPIRFDPGESRSAAAAWPPEFHLQQVPSRSYVTSAMPTSVQPLVPRQFFPTPLMTGNPSDQPQAGNPLAVRAQFMIIDLRKHQTLNVIEQRRLRCIFNACNTQDHFYLYLHQIYCIQTLHPGMLVTLNIDKSCASGLLRLEQILRPNQELSRIVLVAMANFPDTISAFSGSVGSPYNTQAKAFLHALGAWWDNVYQKCRQRGFPPNAQETAVTFFIRSPVMQKIMFTTLHHFLCTPEEAQNFELASTALGLFERDNFQFPQGSLNGSNLHMRTLDGQKLRQFGDDYIRIRTQLRIKALQQSAITTNAVLAQLNTHSDPPLLTSNVMQNNTESRPISAGAHNVPIQPPARLEGDHQVLHNNLSPMMSRPLETTGTTYLVGNNAQAVMLPRNQQITSTGVPTDNHLLNCFKENERLFPPAKFQMPILTVPNPDESALHQAHLQSPKFHKIDVTGNAIPATRLYQYVQGFALQPKLLDRHTLFVECSFDVPPDKHCLLVKDMPRVQEFAVHGPRLVSDGNLLYRLKCSLLKGASLEAEHDLDMAAPVSWPSCCFVSFNENPDVELRKKSHHGRDLTADLTADVRLGENNLKASFYWTKEEHEKKFAFVVEIVRVVDHAKVLSLLTRISAELSLSTILASLKLDVSDDDVMAVDSFISIDLTDPLTAVIWKTPVRGTSCLHRECFDLESFLQSRRSRQQNGPTDPDEWKCPICKRDARPTSLVIDEFLVEVRNQLEMEGKLEAKAIRVEEHGTWQPRFEVNEDRNAARMTSKSTTVTTQTLSGNVKVDISTPPAQTSKQSVAEQEVIIIEIDDD